MTNLQKNQLVYKKKTRNQKQKHRPMKDNAHRQYVVSLYQQGCQLQYMSIITMRSRRFPANSASDCLRFAKFRPQFSESCGATYILCICEMFSALQSKSCLITNFEKKGPYRFIIDDAIVPQTGTKLTKKRGSKFGALLWRHLMPQR